MAFGSPLRRAVGVVAMLVFLVLWIVGAIALAGMLPNSNWIRFAFYAIAGTACGLPLFPLISWSERGNPRP